MSDVTEEQTRHIETESKFAAIERSMAIAQFDLDGTIEWANRIFTDAMGYTVEEAQGPQHLHHTSNGTGGGPPRELGQAREGRVHRR